MEGFNEFLNSTLGGEEFDANPSRVQRLLRVFRRSMR